MTSALTEDLKHLLQSLEPGTSSDMRLALGRLSAELKERFHRGSPASFDFVSDAVHTLSRIKGSANAELRMGCLFDGGAFLYSNRYDKEALSCATQLTELAKQSGDKTWQRKGHMLQGIAYAHMGDTAEALYQYFRALQLCREAFQPDGEAAVLGNLGMALNYCGLYREAIPCFKRVIALSRNNLDASTYEASALCNLAQSHFYLGEFEEGYRAIELSLQRSATPTDSHSAFNRTVREFTFVQLALELGKLSAAREHSVRCREFSLQSGTRRSEFVAVVSRALCEIHGGDAAQGLHLLEAALQNSGDTGSAEYYDALRALVKGYDYASRPKDALENLGLLLRAIRDSREKGLVALLSATSAERSDLVVASETIDLREYSGREARLRAEVAEREVTSSRLEVLERFAIASDIKEESSGEHGFRVGRLTALVAEQIGWSKDVCHSADIAARLHDIGKVAVPDRILLNSTELKEAERHFISAHTTIGAELLAKSNIPQLRMAEEIARHHHEWWNGEGYPSKLKGKRIPIHARIVALADVFDALTHGRPFSKPWPIDQAIEEIKKRKGTQFDPEITEVFLALIERLRNEHEDLDEYLGRAGRNSPFLQARNKIRLMLAEERENEKMATVEGNQTRH